jgi:hypothetical protein
VEEQIRKIESVLTMTGGDVVYSAGHFATFAPEPPPTVSPAWSPVAALGGYQQLASVTPNRIGQIVEPKL